jgi:phosphohistidine phosphatase
MGPAPRVVTAAWGTHHGPMAKARFQVYLVRHADAGNPAAWSGPDEQRPLSQKGERQAERLGKFLAGIRFAPDAIVSSPKLRARQTAEAVAAEVGRQVELDARLGGDFGVDTIGDWLDEHSGATRVVFVGHDPDFSDVVAELCASTAIPMAKGALARLDLDDRRARSATIRWLIPPDALKPES